MELPCVQHVSTGPPHACAAPLNCNELTTLPWSQTASWQLVATALHMHLQGCLSATACMFCWQQASSLHAHAWPVPHSAVRGDWDAWYASSLSQGSWSALRMHMPAQSVRVVFAIQYVMHTWQPYKPGQTLHLHGACNV